MAKSKTMSLLPSNNHSSASKNIKTPNQPVPTFLQEAHNLYVWCQDDAAKLNSVGITNKMIADLPQRTTACSEAHAQWNSYRNTSSNAEKQWKIQAMQAIQFRVELLNGMRYAFRKDKNLLSSLSSVSKGTGYADLIQDLNDLAVLGQNNKELLIKIGYDISLLDVAAARSKELAELWATANVEKDSHNTEYKQNRNGSFWHLHELVTEIREAGRYIFRNDKSRYIGYTSTYWKNKNGRKTKPSKPKLPDSSDSSIIE